MKNKQKGNQGYTLLELNMRKAYASSGNSMLWFGRSFKNPNLEKKIKLYIIFLKYIFTNKYKHDYKNQ